MSIHRTQFSPTRHGFHFSNSFTDKNISITFPAVSIPGLPPFPGKTIAKNFSGRCAGMTYAALDYYWNQSTIPTHTGNDFGSGKVVPDLQTGLGKYIDNRHNTANSPQPANDLVMALIILMPRDDLSGPSIILPFTSSPLPVPTYKGSYNLTHDVLNDIRTQIDQGNPVPICLVADQGIDSVSAGNHAVVAYGYDDSNRDLYVYDCNFPDRECYIRANDGDRCFDTYSHDGAGWTKRYSWKGYSRRDYSTVTPTYFDLSLKTGVTCKSGAGAVVGSISHGQTVTAEYTVVNTGQYTARLRAYYLNVLKVNHAGDETGIAEDHGLGAVDTNSNPNDIITLAPNQTYQVSKVSAVFDSAATYRIAASYLTTQGDMAWGYHRLPNVSDRTWLRIEVGLTIGDLPIRPDVGLGHFIGVGGTQYALVKPLLGIGTDHLLYTRATLNAGTPQDSGWVQVPNSGYVLGATVLPDGTILGIGTDNTFWTRATLNSDWVQVPNSGYVLGATVLSDGTILGIGMDNTFWTRATLNSNWVQVPNSGYVMGATVMRDGTILGVGTDHTLWTRATLNSNWVQVPNSGAVTGVLAMRDGTLLGIGLDQYLWTRATLTSDWVQVPNSGRVIGVAQLTSV